MGERNISEGVDIRDVAKYFLAKDSISPKKLQKLLYFAYAWWLYLNSEDADHINVLFKERPQAWIHGPVFKVIYDEYKINGWHKIPKFNGEIKIKDSELIKFLEKIRDKYGSYDADELEAATHCEDPWRKARNGASLYEATDAEMDDIEIFKYYDQIAR